MTAKQQPVVALESTVISHGLPFPQNLRWRGELEAIVRDGGRDATYGWDHRGRVRRRFERRTDRPPGDGGQTCAR